MNSDNERFWRSLRRATAHAQQAQRAELAQAERMLQDLQSEDEPETTTEQREAMVTAAEALAAQAHATDAHDDRQRQSRFGGGLLAAAAALLLTPKYVVAVATTAAVVTFSATYFYGSTVNVPAATAISVLVDERQPLVSRRTALGRIFMDCVDCTRILQQAHELPDLQGSSLAALTSLAQQADLDPTLFAQPPANLSTHYDAAVLIAWKSTMYDTTLPSADREQALTNFALQAHWSLEALQFTASQDPVPLLRQIATRNLARLRMLLSE